MKKIYKILSILFLFCTFACTTVTVEHKSLTRQQIIEAPNVNKDDLFVKANTTAVDVFNNADAVIQYSDKEAGIIKGKFITDIAVYGGTTRAEVTITIEVKDEKVRLSFSDVDAWYVNIYGQKVPGEPNLKHQSSNYKKLSAILDALANRFTEKFNEDTSW
ncbi:MAG: DUF4468 domain-containing protein [Spirochaetales bacterium]|nr:DUF4468 domain-containing protein [Spirochaetales bacterium]